MNSCRFYYLFISIITSLFTSFDKVFLNSFSAFFFRVFISLKIYICFSLNMKELYFLMQKLSNISFQQLFFFYSQFHGVQFLICQDKPLNHGVGVTEHFKPHHGSRGTILENLYAWKICKNNVLEKAIFFKFSIFVKFGYIFRFLKTPFW